MKIHKEGYRLLFTLAVALLALHLLLLRLFPDALWFAAAASLTLYTFILWFFRHPERLIREPDDQLVYAPADGRVVVIEETRETEYFHDRRLQVSIFMSVTDVHLNRVPISGKVIYQQYHPGRFLVAWHPKSSTHNERNTVVIQQGETAVLLRQIAGALARRIRSYLSAGQQVRQGQELGFIKFGSRVDLLLPVDARIKVRLGQKVRGNRTVVAKLQDFRPEHRLSKAVEADQEEGWLD